MTNIAVFASGNGSNATALADYFQGADKAQINLFITNNEKSGIFERGKKHDIPVTLISNSELMSDKLVNILQRCQTDLIILAGFLRKIPENLLKIYPNRILNIHPALLPDFGGKGMYGHNVHRAVSKAKCDQSGISIHLVNEEYDRGRVIFQKSVPIEPGEDPTSIEKKVRQLELKYYPIVVDVFIQNQGWDRF
ncbi:MAG: phosphoribosylglycinamide formyltransferase [Saprospirales bacterium]|nr:MAG: phosphoribosylglycinamide formyltransferase [Saprospirales bacterium]